MVVPIKGGGPSILVSANGGPMKQNVSLMFLQGQAQDIAKVPKVL